MKKCAVINDLSGFGKCSLAASIPILSVMGCEAHPLPTAILSNQTAYDSYTLLDFTPYMEDYVSEWKKLGVSFDAILTGFSTSEKQLDIISDVIDSLNGEHTLVVVDPVMADNGALYDGYTSQMCEKIKKMCLKADIITPNIAELAFLADMPYSEDFDTLVLYGKKLISQGIKGVVATGYKSADKISNIVFEKNSVRTVTTDIYGGYFSGTGDILASIVTGGVLNGLTLYDSTVIAAQFIETVIKNTCAVNPNDGIEFEKYLKNLII